MKLTATEAGHLLAAKIVGDAGFVIDGVGSPKNAGAHTVCFIESESYLEDFRSSSSRCWVMTPALHEKLDPALLDGKTFLLVEKPYHQFIKLVDRFHPRPKSTGKVSPQSFIDPSAEVHPTAQIDAFVSVGPRAKIGANAILQAGVWIAEEATIGDDSVLYGGVKVYHRCVVGKRAVIHAGAVIGSDGFGFLPEKTGLLKIPQVGRVVIEDDVEIGANTTIDRGTFDDTVVGRGSKIDNLVQIGHNCRIGMYNILCAFVGLSGNTVLGNNVLMAGAAATKGHLKIGDNSQVGGQSGVTKDIPPNSQVKGYPAQPVKDFLKLQVLFSKLPEIYKRLVEVEKKVNQ